MKFIIIGLGYFGSKLANLLTQQGHEVIGIDKRSDRIEEMKDSVSIAMEMDTSSENAVKSLPLSDVDAIVVAIGEDISSSILTLAILKNQNISRIIGRSISPLHHNILRQIGIEEIINPEEETAFSVSSVLQLKNALKVTELDHENVIAELFIPQKYVGHNLESINIEKRFDLKFIALKTGYVSSNSISQLLPKLKTHFYFDDQVPLKEQDVLIVAGRLNDIRKFTGE